MSSVHFGNPEAFYLLWILPLLCAIHIYGFNRKDRSLKRFAEAPLLHQINFSVNRTRQWWKTVAVVMATFLLIISLARPEWNLKPEEIKGRGRDIGVVLDLSRSMLAEDLKPNRLIRAKLAVRDLLERLQGDRVGLVAFAGNAVVKCPLTLDYGFLLTVLEDIGVESIPKGGTLIGDALRKTAGELFADNIGRFEDVILITDGDDHESLPLQATEEISGLGIRLIAIGLGDETEGERIPLVAENGERSFLRHQGKEVWSRLNSTLLRQMIELNPGGKYLNARTGSFDLGEIYRSLTEDAVRREIEAGSIQHYQDRFQWFLAAVIFLLVLEMLLPERNRSK